MNSPTSQNIMRRMWLLYGLMMVGAWWVWVPLGLPGSRPAWLALGWGMAVATFLIGITVGASRWLTTKTQWGRRMEEALAEALPLLNQRQVLILAMLSSVGEEIVFRGVLQPRLGLWVATLLFGLLHVPLKRVLLPWTLFALLMGLVLGLLTEWSGHLWPAIWLHFGVNYLNLGSMSRRHPLKKNA